MSKGIDEEGRVQTCMMRATAKGHKAVVSSGKNKSPQVRS